MPLRRAPNCAMGPIITRIALQVDLEGFEPSTSSEARSQLRYRPLIQGWIDFTLRIVECQANNNRVTGILLRYFFEFCF
jgi:hypothetical protein